MQVYCMTSPLGPRPYSSQSNNLIFQAGLCSKSAKKLSIFYYFYLKLSSRYWLVHILSTSSSKSAKKLSFFYDSYVKSSSRYSMLSTSSSKSAKKLTSFYYSWNWALATGSCTFCRPHLQKVQKKCQIFLRFLCEIELSLQYFVDLIFKKCKNAVNFLRFYVKSSSRYSILSTSSSKNAKKTIIFWRFLREIELSLQSRADFVDLIFKKCKKVDNVLLLLFEIELSLLARAHFVDLIFKKCK